MSVRGPHAGFRNAVPEFMHSERRAKYAVPAAASRAERGTGYSAAKRRGLVRQVRTLSPKGAEYSPSVAIYGDQEKS
jgi:hypothetical protein